MNPVSTLIDGVEVVDLLERVPGGWYEIASLGSDVRMEVREGHDILKISVNGHPLGREDPETRRVFSKWPSQFTAVLLVATQIDLVPGRYMVTTDRITAMPGSAFEHPVLRSVR
jgi:hypothetical protein